MTITRQPLRRRATYDQPLLLVWSAIIAMSCGFWAVMFWLIIRS
jgi:hypothetical protein